ncbi:hypothetical protein BGZ65_007727 [Modicella reniformis]|uniref:Uncharacterized protein n=1 Tax=Modicella reniformis TaxID=1440133 RepID=A0A9P6JMF2_9FUNG|nr:hypothetical protein BGZ65_007727 [Modicella reniformis]
MMMQNMSSNSDYVPPPPHPASTALSNTSATSVGATAAAAAAAGYAASRPSDSFPQSLRSRPKGWDNPDTEEPSSGILSTDTHYNDKAEFGEGEELEPPRSRSRFANENSSRRSMTPPRANMQSYRDDYNRPSFEREVARTGSEASGLNMLRGVDSDNEQHDSPESARRRARAAELFSAESTRR